MENVFSTMAALKNAAPEAQVGIIQSKVVTKETTLKIESFRLVERKSDNQQFAIVQLSGNHTCLATPEMESKGQAVTVKPGVYKERPVNVVVSVEKLAEKPAKAPKVGA